MDSPGPNNAVRGPEARALLVTAPSAATIPFSTLLAVYAITPVLLLLAAADYLFFNGAIRSVLPAHPEDVFLFALLFNIPHAVASFFSFADKEYLSFYRSKLFLVYLCC